MDTVVARRLALFAASTGVDVEGTGRVYPRNKFSDLLVDLLRGRGGTDRRVAATQVRQALADATELHCLVSA